MTLQPATPILLRTSPRDIRVARRVWHVSELLPGSASARFAQVLRRRYFQHVPSLPLSTLSLRRGGIGGAVYINEHYQFANHDNYWSMQVNSQVSPQLNLTVLAWAGQPERRSEAPQTLPVPQLPGLLGIKTIETVMTRRITHMVEQMAETIMAQKMRHEMPANAVTGYSAAPASFAAVRVSHPQAERGSDNPTSSQIAQQKAEEKLKERKRPPQFDATPLTPVNITQLADQVIRQIDQRIIAQRERLGKV